MVISVRDKVCKNVPSVNTMLCKHYERHNNLYWYFHHRISQVVDYDVQFKESGTQYTEKIQVDTNKQTELFKVPAHNDVDGSNILHDFKAVSLSRT